MRANETSAAFMDEADALADRKTFVKNIGDLLSQTRESVKSCELDDSEIVTVTFNCGTTRRVNVNLDSYTAIIRDVVKNI